MPNIIITLLNSRRTRTTINELDVQVGISEDFIIVAGENLATTIKINYPPSYANQECYVYMKNAKGEYAQQTLSSSTQNKTFDLPSSMTYAGNTILIFYAKNNATSETTVWAPIIIPITETGVDYKEVARCQKDFLEGAIKKIDTIEQNEQSRISNENSRISAENTRVSNENSRANYYNEIKPQMDRIIKETSSIKNAIQNNRIVAKYLPQQILDLFSNDTYGFSVTTTPNQWQGGIELDIPAEYNAIVRINLVNGATNPRAIALTSTNAVPNATNTIAEYENPNNRAVSLTTFINAEEQAQKFYVFGKWLGAGTGKIIVSVTLMEQLFKTFVTRDNKQVILADGKKLKVLK